METSIQTNPSEEDFRTVGAFMCTADEKRLEQFIRSWKPCQPIDRRVAAHVLSLVASEGESGNIDQRLTPEIIGDAIARLVSNYTEDESWLKRFLSGLVN